MNKLFEPVSFGYAVPVAPEAQAEGEAFMAMVEEAVEKAHRERMRRFSAGVQQSIWGDKLGV